MHCTTLTFLLKVHASVRKGHIVYVGKRHFDIAAYRTEPTFSTQAEPTSGHSCIQNEEARKSGPTNVIQEVSAYSR